MADGGADVAAVGELTPYMPLALAMRSQAGERTVEKQLRVPPRKWDIEMFRV